MDYRVFFKFSLFGLSAGLLAGIALPALAGAGEKTLRCNLRHACMNELECLNMGEDMATFTYRQTGGSFDTNETGEGILVQSPGDQKFETPMRYEIDVNGILSAESLPDEDKPNTIDRLVIGPNGLGVLYSFWNAENSATAILAYGTCWND